MSAENGRRLVDILGCVDFHELRPDTKFTRCLADRIHVDRTLGGIPEHNDARKAGNYALEQFKPFARHFRGVKEYPCEIATGMAVALGVAHGERIGVKIVSDDWNLSRCRDGGARSCSTNREEHVDFLAHEVRHNLGHARRIARGIAMYDYDVITVDPTMLAQRSIERCDPCRHGHIRLLSPSGT